uniref:Vacuolar-sorting protein SNF8 n=1 Tax=Tabanus bromius TaxID=304241 RepID=A0A0K8TR35_TABBR
MRRRPGLASVQQQQLAAERYEAKGTVLQESQLEQMVKHMDIFREKLEEFTMKHRSDIRKNTQFRRQFQQMCGAIGVDPLASRKGFWSILGMGDFYYELGVQVVEACLAANRTTGGYMELNELRQRLIAAKRNKDAVGEITNDDILMAANKLSIFGNGFTIYPIGGGKHMVQSVPRELSSDEATILKEASEKDGHATISFLVQNLGWSPVRAKQVLDKTVSEGMSWIDEQGKEPSYWFPSLFSGRRERG